jgi:hypothetical protein
LFINDLDSQNDGKFSTIKEPKGLLTEINRKMIDTFGNTSANFINNDPFGINK